MAWKYVQYNGETGKRRTVSGGGGGASALTDLDDVNVSSPSDGQILKYDNASSKWVNANLSVGHTYSTTEQVVGTWIDGRPVYEKTIDWGYLPNDTASVLKNHNISNLDRVVKIEPSAVNSAKTLMPITKASHLGLQYIVDIAVTSTDVVVTCGMDRSGYYLYVTLYYTKATD